MKLKHYKKVRVYKNNHKRKYKILIKNKIGNKKHKYKYKVKM